MRRKAKQDWTVGAIVRVGFLDGLTVVEKVPTPGDFKPDYYVLTRGTARYEFTPHNGLIRIE
jgi:hypothetical protein